MRPIGKHCGGLADGTLATLGSDHVSFTRLQKEGSEGRQFGNIWSSMRGMAGMECLLPVMMTLGVRTGRLGMEHVARICSENVARRFGLYPRKGVLQVGSDADLVIVDPSKRATVDDQYFRGGVTDWSIYHGFEFYGMPETTVIRGELVVHETSIVGKPGYGTYVGSTSTA